MLTSVPPRLREARGSLIPRYATLRTAAGTSDACAFALVSVPLDEWSHGAGFLKPDFRFASSCHDATPVYSPYRSMAFW